MNFPKIQKELADKKRIEACAKEFGVIGDDTRLKICYLLCRHPELSVSQIAGTLGLPVSTVSHSLHRLKEIQLAKTRRDAQTIFYSLKESPLTHLLKTYLKAI